MFIRVSGSRVEGLRGLDEAPGSSRKRSGLCCRSQDCLAHSAVSGLGLLVL